MYGFSLTVPMRLWSRLLASSCSLSHSSFSFSPGKATPNSRVKPEDSVWLARVTEDSWNGTEMKSGEKIIGEHGRGKRESYERDGWPCVSKSPEQKSGLWQTQHPAADISRPFLLWNPSLPSDSLVWKLSSLPGSIWMRKIPLTQHVSHLTESHEGPNKTDFNWWDGTASFIAVI